ncbi:hypothetical protein [Nocardioides bruguierae]|uniref:hypothetical protein n=1 Tax=Nocardioides bruguierae TaxID=2945102 RepID=UPI002021714A|nr:hypothetical protein [Nocardioides bruguierae]MCL8025040.1 hypothetical protein [Nocardioides bruguierae]
MGCCPLYPEPGTPVSMEPGHFPDLRQQVLAVVDTDEWVDVLVEQVDGHVVVVAALSGERTALWHHHPFTGSVEPGHAARLHRTALLLGWPGFALNVRVVGGEVPVAQEPSPGPPARVRGTWMPALTLPPGVTAEDL